MVAVSFFILDTLSVFRSNGMISEKSFYPQDATVFLRSHPTKGQIFSPYNWGGYLLWKLPEKKVFVDGRMPSWEFDVVPPGESKNAFLEQAAIGKGERSLKDAVAAYGITTFLLPAPEPHRERAKEHFYLYTHIISLGFKEVYRDEIAIVYRK